jgi:hypothetical protein
METDIVEHFKTKARQRAAYRDLFATPDGISVLRDLVKQCGVLKLEFNPDARMAAWEEGRRSVLIQILKTIHTDEARMIEEIERLQSNPDSNL